MRIHMQRCLLSETCKVLARSKRTDNTLCREASVSVFIYIYVYKSRSEILEMEAWEVSEVDSLLWMGGEIAGELVTPEQ